MSLFAQNGTTERYHSFDLEAGYAQSGYIAGASYNHAFFDHWKLGLGVDYLHQTLTAKNIPVTDLMGNINVQYVFKTNEYSDLSFAVIAKGIYGKEQVNNGELDIGNGLEIKQSLNQTVKGAAIEVEAEYFLGFNKGRNRSYWSAYARPSLLYLDNSEVGNHIFNIKIGIRYNWLK